MKIYYFPLDQIDISGYIRLLLNKKLFRIYNLQENEKKSIYLKQKLTALLPFEAKDIKIEEKKQQKSIIKHNYYT